MRRHLRWACLLIVMLAAFPAAASDEEVWLLVDTAAERARLFRGNQPIANFDDLAYGRGGTARVRTRGDRTTPLGEFHVTRVNYESRFHIFLELDYPTMRHAERALEAGVIDHATYQSVLDGVAAYGQPPQDTALGGNIGIHGLGKADPVLHRRLHWTEGCVAFTDQQVETLSEWVEVGTRVVIR